MASVIDGKTIANSIKGPLPKLDLTPRDSGLLLMNVSLAILTKDELIKHKLIPSKIAE